LPLHKGDQVVVDIRQALEFEALLIAHGARTDRNSPQLILA